MSDRLTRIREKLPAYNIDTLIISDARNRRYVSGFTGSAGVLIISSTQALLATDFRYYTQAEEEAPAFELARVSYKLHDYLADLLEKAGGRRVGFESEHLSVAEYQRWQEAAPDVTWVPTQDVVEQLRAVKEPGEIETIRRAVQMTDQAFAQVVPHIRPGMTEKAIAWQLEVAMRERGAEDVAFDIIVASGRDSAKPHYRPADKEVQAGVPIVIDMGALLNGYHADMTRTVVIGEPDEMFRKLYQLVLEAETSAETHIRAGMNCKEADALARDVISAAGYDEYFGHGLGHGVGLAIHEAPRLSFTASEEDLLQVNMVTTIEPGVYLPEWGGIRIENLVVVKEAGVEVLTQTPKALEAQIIPL